ncbi:MAG: hypothetical protein CVU56_11100 [Deltaproteobacteria bacterium HGW-Deltaproteobacteria-14]|jgi:hypothetical protein|nr:MAG: hypothetical protein CVU56_11100 [Deltaproteobacteria bacterium HGW-Deltaproteobacteria-14]
MAVTALVAGLVLAGCAHAGEPPESVARGGAQRDEPSDVAAFRALTPGDRLALAGERVMALRTTLARVFARIEGLRDAVRMRDALADWGQLVCLEARVPEVQDYARRGERAWDALREAIREDETELAWTRYELLRIARLGVSKELGAARACGAMSGGAVKPTRTFAREAIALREQDPASVLAHGATARQVEASPQLPAVFVPGSF